MSWRTLAGISRRAYQHFEHGTQTPNIGIALWLARALGVAVDELFSLNEGELVKRRVWMSSPGNGRGAHQFTIEAVDTTVVETLAWPNDPDREPLVWTYPHRTEMGAEQLFKIKSSIVGGGFRLVESTEDEDRDKLSLGMES